MVWYDFTFTKIFQLLRKVSITRCCITPEAVPNFQIFLLHKQKSESYAYEVSSLTKEKEMKIDSVTDQLTSFVSVIRMSQGAVIVRMSEEFCMSQESHVFMTQMILWSPSFVFSPNNTYC